MTGAPQSNSVIQESRRLTTLALRIVTVLVFVLFGFGLRFLLERFYPGFRAAYYPVILGISSVIATYSYSRRKTLEGRDKTLFWVSELITLAVLLKVFLLVRGGGLSIQTEIAALQSNFFEAVFNPSYIFILFSGLLIWVLTNYLAGLIDQMHEREKDVVWDDLGRVQNSLKQIRNQMIAIYVSVLVFFVFIIAIASVPIVIPGVLSFPKAPAAPIWMAMLFGTLLLIILSLTQFTLMRSRWDIDRSKVSSIVPRQWLISGLILIGVIGIVAAILPTRYSISFFDLLIWLSNILVQIASILIYLLTLPFALLSRLFSGDQPETPEPQPFQLPRMEEPPPAQAFPPFLAIIRDLLFWGLTFAIISFAFYQFISSNSILVTRLRSFGFVKWLSNAIQQILALFRGAGRVIQEQIARIQKSVIKLPGINLSGRIREGVPKDPRGRIIYLYKELVIFAGEHGIHRQEYQTPYQYKATFEDKVPVVVNDVTNVTNVFVESRYSRHPVDEQAAERFSEELENIKKTLNTLDEQKTGDTTPPV
jgi:hypothetical protein